MSVKPKNPSFSRRTFAVAAPAIALSAAVGNRVWAQSSFYNLPDASTLWKTFDPTPMPPLAFQDAKGKTLFIDDFKGHVLLLNLWATWCGPCKVELPIFNALAPKLRSFGGLILPISLDAGGVETVEAYFAEKNILNLPVLSNPSGSDLDMLSSDSIPNTVVVRPDGKAVAQLVGAGDWDNQNVVDALQRLAMAYKGGHAG